MRKFFLMQCCALLACSYTVFASPPVEGTNYHTIESETAQAYISNFSSRSSTSFKSYLLDIACITNMARTASAIKVYNATAGNNKMMIFVPVDANGGTVSGGQMFVQPRGVCPPDCGIISVTASAVTMSVASTGINNYNNSGGDAVNAFIVYPAAIASLKGAGATSIQVSHGLSTADNTTRYMIYTGFRADGSVAGCMAETGSSICTKCGL